MNLQRIVWPVAILSVILATAVAFFDRAPKPDGRIADKTTSDEAEATPLPRMMTRTVPSIAVSDAVPHPRTWRANAVDAYHKFERSGYAWSLRQMGMSEQDLDRLASDGFRMLIGDLIKKADQGDRSSILSLGWLSGRCLLLRNEDVLDSHQQIELQNASLLPVSDAEWFKSFLNQEVNTEKQRIADCALIDQDHVDQVLTKLSNQGNGGATFLLAAQANNIYDEDRLARQAALKGFPEAQYEWALDICDGGRGFWHAQPGDPSAVDFLRSAAGELAAARASLAICENRGCAGDTPDPEQAVVDARIAAQQGDSDSFMYIAQTAPPSLISPAEAQAWALFDVALQQRGCRVGSVTVKWMKSMAEQVSKATPQAQVLADEEWERYGANAMQLLGC